MKFLLELVPCCGSPTAMRRKVPGPHPPPPPPESEDDNNLRSLVLPPPPPLRLRKRVRTAAAATRSRSWSSSAEWSPSLGVISEDRAVTTTAKGLVTGQRKVAAELAGSIRVGAGRKTSGCGGSSDGRAACRSRAPDRDRRRRDRDDYEYGRSSLPTTMIAAFSPTPFVF